MVNSIVFAIITLQNTNKYLDYHVINHFQSGMH